jgi:hypothetical protein
MSAMAVSDFGACIWQRKPEKSQCRVSEVHYESEARPKEDSHGSFYGSGSEFPWQQEDVRIGHDALSKANTTGIPDDAS